jgi:hypothetical protein
LRLHEYGKDVTVESSVICEKFLAVECFSADGDRLSCIYCDGNGLPISETWYYIFMDCDLKDAPADWSRGGSSCFWWSHSQPAKDDRRILEYSKITFTDGILTDSEYHRFIRGSARASYEYYPTGMLKKVTLFGSPPPGVKAIFKSAKPRKEYLEYRRVITIEPNGNEEKHEFFQGDNLLKTTIRKGPLVDVSVEPLDGGGWRIKGEILRNYRRRFPTFFTFTANLSADWEILALSGETNQYEWGKYGYVSPFEESEEAEFLREIERYSGITKERFSDLLRSHVTGVEERK